jgi:hypothetical protein
MVPNGRAVTEFPRSLARIVRLERVRVILKAIESTLITDKMSLTATPISNLPPREIANQARHNPQLDFPWTQEA